MAESDPVQKPAVRSVTLPDREYQTLRRIAFEEERSQQAVLAEAVQMYNDGLEAEKRGAEMLVKQGYARRQTEDKILGLKVGATKTEGT